MTILKSLALQKLLYPMSVLPIPDKVVLIVDNMILDLRKPNIKKNIIVLNIEHGGIKLPNNYGRSQYNFLDKTITKWFKC